MEPSSEIKIRFENVPLNDAGKKAEQLRDQLREAGIEKKNISIDKDDPANMDFGATLVLVLGAPAMVVLAKGLRDYLERVGVTVQIEKDGVVTKGVKGSDVAHIVEAMGKRK